MVAFVLYCILGCFIVVVAALLVEPGVRVGIGVSLAAGAKEVNEC